MCTMKVLLIYPNIVESPKDISHGLAQISSLLKKDKHQVELIDTTFKLTKLEIINKVKRFDPNVIGITIATNDKEHAIRLLKLIKPYTHAKIIAGGFHTTIFPEDIIKEKEINGLCIGEGEYPFLEFTNNLQNKKKITEIPNFWYKTSNGIIKNPIRNIIDDVDKIPFPDYNIETHYILENKKIRK